MAVIDRGRILACGTQEDLLRPMKCDWVEVMLSGPLAGVPAELAARTVELLNGGSRLRFLDEPGVLDTALRAVQAQGLKVLHVEVDRTSLEDVFVRLTRMKTAAPGEVARPGSGRPRDLTSLGHLLMATGHAQGPLGKPPTSPGRPAP